jgi:hypothetical protein
MPKINLMTIISIFLNIFLTFWLVNQYLSDAYFKSYVNDAIGQYYAFIVLTIGVGGGSGLGYLFLKKRHADESLIGKIQKSKSFKPVTPLSNSTSTVATSRSSLPTGAPPSQTSRHTVYAVPPLPKSISPSSTRTVPSTSWAAASKPTQGSIASSKLETQIRPATSNAPPAKETPRPAPSGFTTPTQQPPSPLRSIGETPTRSPTWGPSAPPSEDKSSEPGPVFQKPGLDLNAKQGLGFGGYSTPAKGQESPSVPSKWTPPAETKPGPSQWPDTGVRSIPPLPTKWSPPSGTPVAQDGPSTSQGIPRPGQLPPRRPMPPPPQSAPRPFGIPNPGRPAEPRPIAAPQPFRPTLARPPVGPNPQQRPPQTIARPPPSMGGPMPQPWTPSSETNEKKDTSNLPDLQTPFGKPSPETKSSLEPTPSGGGEMDWDTALDTILKTLRKDRVGDTK